MGVENAGAEEIRSRIRRLQNNMAKKGADLVLILQNVDLFYFSGTIQKGYLFVPGEGAVGIELGYIVKENGLERITSFPKELIVLSPPKD